MRFALPLRGIVPLLALSLVAGPVRAELLVNGNFEDGPVIPLASPLYAVAPGSPDLTGWTVVDGAIDIVTDNYWVPLSGHRSVVLSSTGPGAIEQAFATSAGATYRLTFWLSGEPFSSPTLKHLRVTAGATTQDYTFDVTPAWHWDMAWARHTLDFVASSATTTLKFASEDATQWGPAVDSVKVEFVSAGVPASFALAFAPVAPDPVRGAARLSFSLPEAAAVRLAVYDVQGRERALVADAALGAGTHSFELAARAWDPSPGIYLAVLTTGGRTLVRRFTVLD